MKPVKTSADTWRPLTGSSDHNHFVLSLMKINRRNVLKYLTCLPFVGPALAKAAVPVPKPEVMKLKTHWEETSLLRGGSNRGKLIIIIGDPKTGKTSLANEIARKHGYALIDDAHKLSDPMVPCSLWLAHGVNVVVVAETCRFQDSLICSMSGVESGTLTLFNEADWVFEVERMTSMWSASLPENERPFRKSWRCQTIKHRYCPGNDTWWWNVDCTGETWFGYNQNVTVKPPCSF